MITPVRLFACQGLRLVGAGHLSNLSVAGVLFTGVCFSSLEDPKTENLPN